MTIPGVVVQAPPFSHSNWRVHLPLPLSMRPSVAAYSMALGVLGCMHPVERAAAEVCWETGGRVGLDRFIRDWDVGAFHPTGWTAH